MTDQDINSLANVVEEKTLSNVNESTSNLVIDCLLYTSDAADE